MTKSVTPEFSRRVAVDRLPPEGRTLSMTASEAECGALARRFGVDGVDALAATVEVRPLASKTRTPLFEVAGTLSASVRQTCVVSLVPLTRTISETLMQRYGGAAGTEMSGHGEVDLESTEDPPEPLIDDHIDVGELVAEVFGLAIDPHPRAENAVLPESGVESIDKDGADDQDTSPEASAGPFAALAALTQGKSPGKNGS